MTAAQLKASILDLAIRGQLVPQDPNDEPADALLARIWEERSGRGGDFNTEAQGHRDAVDAAPSPRGRARTPAAPLPIPDDEKPFALPAGWEWVRLGDIVSNHGQKQPESIFCYIDIGSIDNINQRLNKTP